MVKVKLTVAAIPGLVGVLCRQKDQPAVVRAVLCVLSRVQSGPGFSSLLAEAVPVLGRIGLVVYVHDLDIVMFVTKLMAQAGHFYVATVLAPWLRPLSTGAPRVCLQPSGARTSSAWAVLATCSTGVVWPGCQRGHVGPLSGPRSGGARVPGPSGR